MIDREANHEDMKEEDMKDNGPEEVFDL